MKAKITISAMLLVALLAGCGGGGSSTTAGSSASSSVSTSQAPPAEERAQGKSGGSPRQEAEHAGGGSAKGQPEAHHDSDGGAAQFEAKGGDNSIQESGSESGGSELQQAATALHAYLDARAGEEWAKACANMAAGVSKSLQQFAGAAKQGKGKSIGCPKLLAALSAGLPPSALREAAIADVGALRVQGGRAFLLFHGAHHADYFMPMAKEGGEWKVAALAASALP